MPYIQVYGNYFKLQKKHAIIKHVLELIPFMIFKRTTGMVC